MEYTDDQNAQFTRQFQAQRRSQRVASAVELGALAIIAWSRSRVVGVSDATWLALAACVFVAGSAYLAWTARCPSCGKWFRSYDPSSGTCRHCGVALR